MNNSRQPAWKRQQGAPVSRTPTGGQDWQRSPSTPRGPQVIPWWKTKKGKIALACSGLFTVMVAFIIVILWLRPERPPLIVLIGAGYEDNPAVPHNVAGRRALDELERWATAQNEEGWGRRQQYDVERAVLDRNHQAVINAVGTSLVTRWTAKARESVVVYVTAYGVAHVDPVGRVIPCLIPHDHDPSEPDKLLTLDALLKALKTLDDKTKKLLVLDVTGLRTSWSLGAFRPSFAEALKSPPYQEEIKSVPNLVVMYSSTKDETSWVASERGLTAFSYNFIEGIKGAADSGNDTRIDAYELYKHLAATVEPWVRHNRKRVQQPDLIDPHGCAGKLTLGHAGSYQEEPLPGQAETEADLRQGWKVCQDLWERCAELEAGTPAPWVMTPHYWRKYQETILRVEQLMLAGDLAAAEKLRDSCKLLEERIRERRTMPMHSLRLAVPMGDALGVQLTAAQRGWLDRFRQQLARQDLENAQADVGRLAAQGGTDWQKMLLRLRAADLVLRHVASDPKKNADACRELLAHLDDVEPKRPAESHLFAMFQPASKEAVPIQALLDAGRWDLLQKAISVRLLAEEAALGREDPGTPLRQTPAYSEYLLAWLQKTVDEADRDRRFGQDLLCTSLPKEWERAEALLGRAAEGYRRAQNQAVEIRKALEQRDRAMAWLPYYSRWVAEAPKTSAEKIERLRDLWKLVHEMDHLLREAPAPNEISDKVERLRGLHPKVAGELNGLHKEILDSVRPEYSIVQENWHEIDSLLRVPLSEPGRRYHLLDNLRRISWQLHHDTKGAGQVKGAEQTAEQVRRESRKHARLALAARGVDENVDEKKGAQLDRDLQEPEEGWPFTQFLVRFGQKMIVDRAYQNAYQAQMETDQAVRTDGKTDLLTAEKKLRKAGSLARQVEAWTVGTHLKIESESDPVGSLCKLLMHNLLCWQAERTFQDHWAAEPDKADRSPYYRLAAQIYLRDAERLINDAADDRPRQSDPRLRRVKETRGMVEGALPFAVEWSVTGEESTFGQTEGRVFLTDEPYVERYYRLMGPKNVPGYPVYWTDYGMGFKEPEETKLRRPRGLGHENRFSQTIAGEGEVSKRETRKDQKHSVRGYFRGHPGAAPILVDIMGEPDLLFVAQPVPKLARLAVRLDDQSALRLAKLSAVAIVLDASNSMNRPLSTQKDLVRWKAARDALREVLQGLPRGCSVSLRVFGAKEHRSENDDQGIRPLWSEEEWDNSPENVNKRMRQVNALTPSGNTPLLEAIKAAREDLPKQPRNQDDRKKRTVIAVTDGGDNYFYDPDPKWNAHLKKGGVNTVAEFLQKHFGDDEEYKDVQLHVFGFDINPASIPPAERRAAKELPDALAKMKEIPGKYNNVKQHWLLSRYLLGAILRTYFVAEPDIARPSFDEPPFFGSLSPYGENLAWMVIHQPGNYIVRTPAVPGMSQRVRVLAGDALILNMRKNPDTGATGVSRQVYAKTPEVRMDRQVIEGKANWWYGILENHRPRTRHGDLTLMTTLEKDLGDADRLSTLQVVRPGWVWYEVFETGKKEQAGPFRVATRPDYPAPAWGLEIGGWPLGGPVTLHTWWTETALADLPHVKRWKREPGVELLTKKEQPLEDGVVLEGIALEKATVHQYRSAVGDKLVPSQEQDCLVVRLRFPPEKGPYFVQLGNFELRYGQVHRHYHKAGKYTGIFWPVTKDQVENIRELTVYSVRTLKERPGTQYRKEDLGPPDHIKSRPPLDGGGARRE